MAILPQVPGLSVSIRVDNQPAEEYHPPHITPVRDPHLDDEVAVTHCFIESQTGKDFRVRYRFSPLFTFPDGADILVLKFFVDGIKCQHQLMESDVLGGKRDYIHDMWYRSVPLGDGRSENYSLTFSEITPVELANKATVMYDLERIKNLGTIKVVIGYGKIFLGRGRYAVGDKRDNEALQVAQKALVLQGQEKTHGTSYRLICVDDTPSLENIIFDRRTEKTMGCFNFSYMSRASLLSNNILNPAFLNHDAHFVQPMRKAHPVRADAKGKIEIDLTGEE